MPQEIKELIFSLDKEYKLAADTTTVSLSVIVGVMGQSPDLDVDLDEKELLTHHKGSITALPITATVGAILQIIGNVVDVASDSNKIEVTLQLEGGVQSLTRTFSVNVEQDGETVDVVFIIRFI